MVPPFGRASSGASGAKCQTAFIGVFLAPSRVANFQSVLPSVYTLCGAKRWVIRWKYVPPQRNWSAL
jgi:hypothetical protein